MTTTNHHNHDHAIALERVLGQYRRRYERVCSAVGGPLCRVETPALVVDLDALERNMRTMRDHVTALSDRQVQQGRRGGACVGIDLRPHAKAHKCADVALLQVERYGAVGVCCQKLSELEVMVGAGVRDVLLSNELVQEGKLRRLVGIAAEHPHCRVSVCVDDAAVVRRLGELCVQQQQRSEGGTPLQLDMVVEVNVGQDRCGVEPGDMVVQLAREVLRHGQPHLRFKGIQCYHGALQHVRQWEERKAKAGRVAEIARKTQQDLRDAGIPCDYVTGAGTGTYDFEGSSGVYTEMQPGSYIFMDADYATVKQDQQGTTLLSRYEQSLHVLATVMSTDDKGTRFVVDAGLKASSLDSGVPLVAGMEQQLEYVNGGDEHGILVPHVEFQEEQTLKVGDQVKLVMGHCDPTVNLYDFMIGYRGDKVEKIMHIAARGPGL